MNDCGISTKKWLLIPQGACGSAEFSPSQSVTLLINQTNKYLLLLDTVILISKEIIF